MKVFLREDGVAVDVDDVSLRIVCSSKEERDQMAEDLKSGMLRMIEWHRVKTRPLTEEEIEAAAYPYDDAVILDYPIPEDGDDVLIAYRKPDGSLAVTFDTCGFDGEGYYLENFGDFTEIEYWAEFPKAPEDPKTKEAET